MSKRSYFRNIAWISHACRFVFAAGLIALNLEAASAQSSVRVIGVVDNSVASQSQPAGVPANSAGSTSTAATQAANKSPVATDPLQQDTLREQFDTAKNAVKPLPSPRCVTTSVEPIVSMSPPATPQPALPVVTNIVQAPSTTPANASKPTVAAAPSLPGPVGKEAPAVSQEMVSPQAVMHYADVKVSEPVASPPVSAPGTTSLNSSAFVAAKPSQSAIAILVASATKERHEPILANLDAARPLSSGYNSPMISPTRGPSYVALAPKQPESMLYADSKSAIAHDGSMPAASAETLVGQEPQPGPYNGQGPLAYSSCNSCPTPGFGCAYGPGQSGSPVICGVNCGACGAPCCSTWCDAKCIPWSLFGPGEYVGPARTEHVSTYYLRVNDLIKLTFITSHTRINDQYRIRVGDRLKIEWLRLESGKDASLDREMLVQPDGTVTLPLVGQVDASGKTIDAFREDVIKLFSKYQKEPQITITPVEINTDLQDIIRAVTGISGSNGQAQDFRVTPEGTIQAPGLGSVFVQGLTLDELRSELEARYAATFGPGLLVSPSLTDRATTYVFVGGEVRNPNRYTLEGPTTVMQAITLAGGWNVGGNTRQVVVFRRDENWCLKATKINLRAPLYGQDPCPCNDTWIRDNDLVIVPKERILCADDVINLYFTRGVYAVFPITFVKDFSSGSAITPIP
ncbi:MAG TPA: polysaccharide biosynthesis/export family protein [Lacipirellulaceae bacterium]|jgi:polysaccharide export outer membrane protein